ncbi:alpha/beta hydrolase [Acinetobacter pittii]|uniref:alpha/beta fold hydrolase n=1 Tax=Acinetobacter pittii TaxID=48296 RepID=UPI000CE55FFD|nr:alpha/beta hydrolase [Acinetobacter pittii]PPC07974.1 alpha/beta hydrolase [Acinetobacter pittii]WPP60519.1 alpha/beta hydrolase [Acinetobacter pittii]
MIQVEQLTLNRDGLTLHGTLYGEADASLVVLIHGFPDTPHSWDHVYPLLVKAGYQVFVPWLRGYTQDSVNRQAHYGLASALADLAAWLELLKAKGRLKNKAHLVGHDWGAAIAMSFASGQSEALHSMSLLAVPPIPNLKDIVKAIPNFPRQLYMSSYMLLMQSRFAEQVLSRNNAGFVEKIWRKWSPTWNFTESDFSPTRAAFQNSDIAWAATRYYHNLFAVLNSDNLKANQHLLSPVTTPTLALAGLADGCMNIRLHQALAQTSYFPQGIESVYVPNCGHFLQAEQPNIIAQYLIQHFQKTDRST